MKCGRKGSHPARHHSRTGGSFLLDDGWCWLSQQAENFSLSLCSLNFGLEPHGQREPEDGATRLMLVGPQSPATVLSLVMVRHASIAFTATFAAVPGIRSRTAIRQTRCAHS